MGQTIKDLLIFLQKTVDFFHFPLYNIKIEFSIIKGGEPVRFRAYFSNLLLLFPGAGNLINLFLTEWRTLWQ